MIDNKIRDAKKQGFEWSGKQSRHFIQSLAFWHPWFCCLSLFDYISQCKLRSCLKLSNDIAIGPRCLCNVIPTEHLSFRRSFATEKSLLNYFEIFSGMPSTTRLPYGRYDTNDEFWSVVATSILLPKFISPSFDKKISFLEI